MRDLIDEITKLKSEKKREREERRRRKNVRQK